MSSKSNFAIPAVAAMSFCLIAETVPAAADILQVPGDYPTIQAAINAASNGDEVVVADAVNTSPNNKNLNFNGRLITVRSENGPAASCDGNIIIHELVSDFSWGYRLGVKQPLGAYKSGLSVHQITKSNFPEGTDGNPDYLFWVDEENESFGVSEMPTDDFHDFCINPGGMVSFSDDGTVWYAYAARSTCLPIDLYSSLRPYDTNAFFKRVDDVDLARGSTTPCINVHDPNLMLFWRHKNAGSPNVSISLRRYDINGDFQLPEFEIELVHGEPHPDLETVGIEQLWTRFDPRLNYTLIAWHFKTTTDPEFFGSDSMLYSDDDGMTWRKADGSPVLDLPVQYSDVDDVLTPVDHLAEGNDIAWLVSDVGIPDRAVV